MRMLLLGKGRKASDTIPTLPDISDISDISIFLVIFIVRSQMVTKLTKWLLWESLLTGQPGQRSCQGGNLHQHRQHLQHHQRHHQHHDRHHQHPQPYRHPQNDLVSRWNHLMLATNASINIFIYVAKVNFLNLTWCCQGECIFLTIIHHCWKAGPKECFFFHIFLWYWM